MIGALVLGMLAFFAGALANELLNRPSCRAHEPRLLALNARR